MTRPLVWTIAGTDPSGGAGIQADLKTMQALGAHGCSVMTAVIAQRPGHVQRVDPVSLDMVHAQIDEIKAYNVPGAIKIGMLTNAQITAAVAEQLKQIEAPVVLDPVLVSSSGRNLLMADAVGVLRDELIPQVDILTPNLPEAEVLSGIKISSLDDAEQAARILREQGANAVLIKGGHREGDFTQDYFTDGSQNWWITHERINTPHSHGTGCMLSSAIVAFLAHGYDALNAVVLARAYMQQGLRLTADVPFGCPVPGPWPANAEDLPWITKNTQGGMNRPSYPDCGDTPLGLYPIVDSVEWIERLAGLGVSTMQLRLKNVTEDDADRMVKKAIEVGKRYNVRLFINDDWQAAIRYGAYGVHLGQEDLDTAELHAIAKAGLRLGTSTHSYAEIARVKAVRPSYLAIGTVFPSPSKPGLKHPQGIEGFSRLCAVAPGRVVAIGGLHPDNAAPIIEAGADGIAVISDIRDTDDVPTRVKAWQALWG